MYKIPVKGPDGHGNYFIKAQPRGEGGKWVGVKLELELQETKHLEKEEFKNKRCILYKKQNLTSDKVIKEREEETKEDTEDCESDENEEFARPTYWKEPNERDRASLSAYSKELIEAILQKYRKRGPKPPQSRKAYMIYGLQWELKRKTKQTKRASKRVKKGLTTRLQKSPN